MYLQQTFTCVRMNIRAYVQRMFSLNVLLLKSKRKSIWDLGLCWITYTAPLFYWSLCEFRHLTMWRSRKGYCAVTRTTHICNGTEKWTPKQNNETGMEEMAALRDEGGAEATRGVGIKREIQRWREKKWRAMALRGKTKTARPAVRQHHIQ